jgi:hypothetical protein
VGETKQVALKVRLKGVIVSFLVSGNIILLILGIGFSYWLNNLFATPIPVLLIGLLPFSMFTVQDLIIPFCLFVLGIFIVLKLFKNTNYLWFFAGASLTSFWFALGSLFEISVVWYKNNGWTLPNIYVESPMPAIYTYKLFKSIFFASLFGLLGHWSQLLRRTKDKPKNYVYNYIFVGENN